jgi:hypothetical protein
VAGLAALLVAGGAAGALALTGGDGEGGDQAGDTTTTSTSTTAGDTTTTADTTATTADILGGLGGDVGLGGSSDGEPSAPLPGDDWSPEAREAFVADCGPDMVEQTGGLVTDGGATCGCIYDEVQGQGIEFAEFSEQWSAEDMDPNSPVRGALDQAVPACMGTGLGF